MATTKPGGSRGLRTRGEVGKRIVRAEQLGMNVNDLINRVLDRNIEDLDEEIRKRESELRALLAPAA